MLKAADGSTKLFIDTSCKSTIESLNQTTYKRGTRDIDKTMNIEHSTDALGYCIELQFPMRKIEIAGISL
jgi:phage terminase large subunit